MKNTLPDVTTTREDESRGANTHLKSFQGWRVSKAKCLQSVGCTDSLRALGHSPLGHSPEPWAKDPETCRWLSLVSRSAPERSSRSNPNPSYVSERARWKVWAQRSENRLRSGEQDFLLLFKHLQCSDSGNVHCELTGLYWVPVLIHSVFEDMLYDV